MHYIVLANNNKLLARCNSSLNSAKPLLAEMKYADGAVNLPVFNF